jgi:DNA-binding MarR family transcriptional regulator
MTTRHDIAIALRRAYLALHRASDAKFEQFGVTADQFVLLATLARGNALTQRELAQRMSSDPSTVRAMLVLLEKRGLVERQSHPTDSRARTVALTTAGKRAFRQLWEAGEPIREQMQSVLSPQEGQQLLALLSRLAEVLTSEREPAGVSKSLFSPEDSP